MKRYFEQVPLSVVKRKIAMNDDVMARTGSILCVICDAPVKLEHCKIDEDGEAVHDKCYLSKIAESRTARSGKNSRAMTAPLLSPQPSRS